MSLYPARSQAELAIERKHREVVNRLVSENRRIVAAEGKDVPPSAEGSALAEAETKATVAVRAAKEAEAKAAVSARKEAEANLALRTSLDSSQQVHSLPALFLPCLSLSACFLVAPSTIELMFLVYDRVGRLRCRRRQHSC